MLETKRVEETVVPFGYHFAESAYDLSDKGSETLSGIGIDGELNPDELLATTKRKSDKFDVLPWAE